MRARALSRSLHRTWRLWTEKAVGTSTGQTVLALWSCDTGAGLTQMCTVRWWPGSRGQTPVRTHTRGLDPESRVEVASESTRTLKEPRRTT